MGFPLVSVILPFYRHAEWLAQAVDSVLTQTYSPVEILVVNDGSAEDMTAFLQQYKDKIRYFSQPNAGPAAARNLGIAQANGEYIAFLDSDDLWLPDKLTRQMAAMQQTGAAWYNCSYTLFDETGDRSVQSAEDLQGRIFPLPLLSVNIATPCVVVRRTLLDQLDSVFPDDTRVGEDTQLWTKLAAAAPLVSVNDPLVRVRLHGSNTEHNPAHLLRSRAQLLTFIEENHYEEALSPGVRCAYRWCRFFDRRLAALNQTSSRLAVLLTKVVYLVPWLTFRRAKKRCLQQIRKGTPS